MEARSYTGGQGRTKMKTLRMSRVDLAAAGVISVFAAVMIYIILNSEPLF